MKKFNPDILISLIIGLVFISEGIQKFLFPDMIGAGKFVKSNIPFAETTTLIVAITEILFGLLLTLRVKVKFVVIPLLVVIMGALVFTKYPLLIKEGFWKAAHESRTDLLILFGLIFLFIRGGFKN